MKTKLLLLIALTFGLTIQAQTYQFILVQNSAYNYSVAAVPDFDSGSNPNLDSYSFTILLPDDGSSAYTVDQSTVVFNEGGGVGTFSYFNATQLNAIDPGNDRSTTTISMPSSIDTLPAHLVGDVIPLVTFDILGSPTTGEIRVLDNAEPLAVAATMMGVPMNSFISLDPTGGNNPTNVYAGQGGTIFYMFSTLGTVENELTGFSIFPNPATDVVKIKGLENTLKSVEVYNITGQKVMTSTSNIETINVSDYANGVYFVKLSTEDASKTIKFIKK